MPRSKSTPQATPPSGVSLVGFYKHHKLEDCIAFVARSLERARLTEDDLLEYQRELLRDLDDPLDEEALASMLAWWDYDAKRLLERSRYGAARPAKPQVEVFLELTSKGNLKAEWRPRGMSFDGSPIGSKGTDFLYWRRDDRRRIDFGSRPSNELFFLRSVESAVGNVTRAKWPAPTAVLDHVLLGACARVVERLKERLQYHFEVRMLTDLFVEWGELEEGRDWFSGPAIVTGWKIEDPAERQRQAELAALANIASWLGCSEDDLVAMRQAEEARRSTSGEPLASHTLADRLTRRLKADRLPATKGKVERALLLIERHRAPSNVVKLRD